MSRSPAADSKGRFKQILRFLVVGGVNTLLTAFIFWVLAGFLPYWVAYIFSFLAGIIFNTIVVPRIVFQATPRPRKLGTYVLWNGTMMLVGALVSALCQSWGIDRLLTIVIVMVLVVPINFIVSRKILLSDEA